jgi:hypothetical protein
MGRENRAGEASRRSSKPMSRSKPKRRWLQFSLRSILLLTLAVALWLGYEVHQARQVERTIAGLAALGGATECELTGWSLLRLCPVPGYGRRIVRADIPGSVAQEAIELLRSSGLHEVQVTYDGTYDPTPSWKALIAALPSINIQPRADEEIDDQGEEGRGLLPRRVQRFGRLATKMTEAYPTIVDHNSYQTGPWNRVLYWVVRLPDDTLAEVYSGMVWWSPRSADDAYFALLVIDDECISVRGFSTFGTTGGEIMPTLEDLNGDDIPEVGFQWTTTRISDSRVRRLAGDPRDWLGVYEIRRDGFSSLLPDDTSGLPNADGELIPVRPPKVVHGASDSGR